MTTIPNAEPDWTPGQTTRVELRPRFEGANIATFIGFKHVNYLVEEAVLDFFRQTGWSSRRLFEEGWAVDLVDLKTRILHALHIDDLVVATVTWQGLVDSSLQFQVFFYRPGEVGGLKLVSARANVVLRAEDRLGPPGQLAQPALAGAAAATLERGRPPHRVVGVTLPPSDHLGASSQVPAGLLHGSGPALFWQWRAPYFYCHHTTRLQLSGVLRYMEEAADLFWLRRGAGIRLLLEEQDWIPVVPVSEVHLVGEAAMESRLGIVFQITSVFRRSTYDARLDCYAIEADALRLVATGAITHGHAHLDSRADWSMVEFDDRLSHAVGA
ncbi:MAG: hypothetical protein LBH76_03255 [Propionibacteriaceae bacterium]|jgi:acyl-CoA thioesterase FadM|nr:hypothetical protein [Propionibacteriaceae bacterium]